MRALSSSAFDAFNFFVSSSTLRFFTSHSRRYGGLAVAAQRSAKSMEELVAVSPADGLVAGLAEVRFCNTKPANRKLSTTRGKWKTVTFFPPAAESAPRTTAAAAAAPRARQSSFRCQAPQAAATTAKSRGACVTVTDQVVS